MLRPNRTTKKQKKTEQMLAAMKETHLASAKQLSLADKIFDTLLVSMDQKYPLFIFHKFIIIYLLGIYTHTMMRRCRFLLGSVSFFSKKKNVYFDVSRHMFLGLLSSNAQANLCQCWFDGWSIINSIRTKAFGTENTSGNYRMDILFFLLYCSTIYYFWDFFYFSNGKWSWAL